MNKDRPLNSTYNKTISPGQKARPNIFDVALYSLEVVSSRPQLITTEKQRDGETERQGDMERERLRMRVSEVKPNSTVP